MYSATTAPKGVGIAAACVSVWASTPMTVDPFGEDGGHWALSSFAVATFGGVGPGGSHPAARL